jgi:thiamine biosynthesis lipoprotein
VTTSIATRPAGASQEETIRRAEPVMGTVVSFHIRPGDVPRGELFLALAEARDRLHRADAVFSTWKKHSPMNRVRRGEMALEDAPVEMIAVLDRCEEARRMSAGWFDPWAAPGGVDPTGLVKGWAAARSLDALADAGVPAAMVNAGGDVAVFGRPAGERAWRIGIQNPFDRSTVIRVVEPQAAVATSGCYERGLHVYDPFLGQQAAAVASATVTGPALDLADALATATLVGGVAMLPVIESLAGFEAFLISHEAEQLSTSGFCRAAPSEPSPPPRDDGGNG